MNIKRIKGQMKKKI